MADQEEKSERELLNELLVRTQNIDEHIKAVERENRPKVMRQRVREIWLLLWGVFFALFIQVFYDAFGHGINIQFAAGLALCCVGFTALAVASKYLFPIESVQKSQICTA
jgi:dipeptide/tripeptide permease